MMYLLAGVILIVGCLCSYLIGVKDERMRWSKSRLSNDARAIALARRDKENK